jgi:hypothetical protein
MLDVLFLAWDAAASLRTHTETGGDWYARYGFGALEGAAEHGPQPMFLDIRTALKGRQ